MSKMKELSFRDKVIHFWMYYKVRTIGFSVLFLLGVAVLLNYLSFDPQGELQIAIQSRYIDFSRTEEWKQYLSRKYDIESEEIKIKAFWTGAPDGFPENQVAYTQFVAGIQLEQIDIIIGDANSMMDSPSLVSYYTLDEVFTEQELSDLYRAAEVNAGNSEIGILKAKKQDAETVIFDSNLSETDSETKCYFLCIGTLSNNIIGSDRGYVGIIRNTPNLEIVKQVFLDLVLGM